MFRRIVFLAALLWPVTLVASDAMQTCTGTSCPVRFPLKVALPIKADPTPAPVTPAIAPEIIQAVVMCDADKAAVNAAQSDIATNQAALATIQSQIAKAQQQAASAQAKLASDTAAMVALLAKLYPVVTPPAPAPTPDPTPTPLPTPPTPASGVTLIEVGRSTGCPACDSMGPIVEGLKKEGLPIQRVDVDQDATAMDKWKPARVPCWIMEIDGKEVSRTTGAMEVGNLRKWIKDTIDFSTKMGSTP